MALKIGILTLPISDNYGGILQAVALYRFLHNSGFEVVLINKQPKNNQFSLKKTFKWILLKIPFHNIKNIKKNQSKVKYTEEKIKLHRVFIEKEIFNISSVLNNKRDLKKFIKKENFYSVIVGSDQVWRKQYTNNLYYQNYFLDFVDGSKIKKVAYAASFGKDYWEGKDDIEDISKLLQDFTDVSVREKSGVDICKNTFAYAKAKHVLDPTFLMDKEFYINQIIAKYDTTRVLKGGLQTYVLDEEEEKENIINFVKYNLNIVNVNHLKGFNKEQTIYSVPEWIASFLNADYIVTDSFHGMVFSIIFEKDFIVIGNEGRGMDRFKSLLSLIGLESRLILNMKDMKNKRLEKIDYSRINKILKVEKKKSKDFLIGVLDAK